VQTKDIPDCLVVLAYDLRAVGWRLRQKVDAPLDLLAYWTGAPDKVCFSAAERALRHKLLDYGVSLAAGFLTKEGKKLLQG